MAKVVVTLNIMPESPEINLDKLREKSLEKITSFAGETETKITIEPIAFGLKALKIIFVMQEAQGSTEPLENDISSIKGVQSVEVIDVRRAMG
jgi:elongation factor 1-beta